MARKRAFSVILAIFVPVLLLAGNNKTSDPGATELDKLFRRSSRMTAVKVIAAADSNILYSRNSGVPMTPASTMKLITSAAALSKLGPHYKFRTTLSIEDTMVRLGMIRGNIYLRGGADPYLTADDLRRMVKYLRATGIESISGDVVADDSFFDQLLDRSDWSDEYTSIRTPPLCGLSIEENSIAVIVSAPSKPGMRLQVNTSPSFPSLRIETYAVSARSRRRLRPSISIEWEGDSPVLYVSGKMNAGAGWRSYTVSLRKPAWFAGAILKAALEEEGIRVEGTVRTGRTPKRAKELLANETPITDVLAIMNKRSDNFAAEMLVKTLGAEVRGCPGSMASGLGVIRQFLGELNISQADYEIHDGSGISHSNQISADVLVAVLQFMYRDKSAFDAFYNSLSTAGVDGTLRRRMHGTDAENNLHGKTGTLSGVTSLAGYVTSADGEILIFSVNSNEIGHGRRRYKSLQDRIGIILANYSRNKSDG